MGTNVFLSYSSADHSVAKEIRSALEANGLTVFDIQNLSAGNAWAWEIDVALKSVDSVVTIISNNYSSSAYTTSEWSAGLAGGKRIIPVLVEHDARVPALLAPYVGIDVSDPDTRAEKLKLLARQIKGASPGAPESLAGGIGSMEKRLNQSRSQQAAVTKVRELVLLERITRFRLLTIALAGTFLLVTIMVVAILAIRGTYDYDSVLTTLASMLTGTLGFLFGRSRSFRSVSTPSSRSNKEPRSGASDPDSQATSEDGVRP